MRCYRARCILEESIIRRTRDNEEEYDTFFDEKNQLINEFNEMARTMTSRSCAFISSAVKDQAIIGVMMTDIEADVKAYVKNFFSFIKLECVDISFEEITVETFKRMIPNGYHDNFKFDEDLLNDYELDDLFSNYRRSYISENITKSIDKKDALSVAKKYLCSDTFEPELKRIFRKNSVGVTKGIPVHYLVQSDNAHRLVDTLVSSLYSNNRLGCARYTVLDLYNLSARSSDIRELFRVCSGSTIIMNCCGLKCTNSDNCTADETIPDILFDLINDYKNEIQFIFTFSNDGPSLPDAVEEKLGAITFVKLADDTVENEDAHKYLRKLCREENTSCDKDLLSLCAKDTPYRASELMGMYDTWYSNVLKTKIYPQYSNFKKLYDREEAKEIKGSAYSELQELIGLDSAKSVIEKAITYSKAQKIFADKGMKESRTAMHMVFTGNPGTAKTTVARLFARILKENGVLSKGDLIECGRSDLVGKYVGWTAVQVKNMFKKAKGSVLFIDEAYSLCDDRSGSYGDEAINTIVQEMENNRDDMVVIFAGYPKEMNDFLDRNPGLRSRIAFHVNFEDYTAEELLSIVHLMAKNNEHKLADDVDETLLPFLERVCKKPNFGNGRFARNLIEGALFGQALRLTRQNFSTMTMDDIVTLKARDFDLTEDDTLEEEQKHIGFNR